MSSSTVVAIVIVFAMVGVMCVLGGAMVAACYAMDHLWESCARRISARREGPAQRRPELVEELYGRRWTERDNDLYLTGFDAWRQISPEGSTGE
jgi:hypothetical protein